MSDSWFGSYWAGAKVWGACETFVLIDTEPWYADEIIDAWNDFATAVPSATDSLQVITAKSLHSGAITEGFGLVPSITFDNSREVQRRLARFSNDVRRAYIRRTVFHEGFHQRDFLRGRNGAARSFDTQICEPVNCRPIDIAAAFPFEWDAEKLCELVLAMDPAARARRNLLLGECGEMEAPENGTRELLAYAFQRSLGGGDGTFTRSVRNATQEMAEIRAWDQLPVFTDDATYVHHDDPKQLLTNLITANRLSREGRDLLAEVDPAYGVASKWLVVLGKLVNGHQTNEDRQKAAEAFERWNSGHAAAGKMDLSQLTYDRWLARIAFEEINGPVGLKERHSDRHDPKRSSVFGVLTTEAQEERPPPEWERHLERMKVLFRDEGIPFPALPDSHTLDVDPKHGERLRIGNSITSELPVRESQC